MIHKRRQFELLESRQLLTKVAMIPHVVGVQSEGRHTTAEHFFDSDGDGNVDIVSISIHDSEIKSHLNLSGDGQFQIGISDFEENGLYASHAVDIDSDDDVDLLFALSDRIVAYRNNGNGDFEFGGAVAERIQAFTLADADLDGDGDFDIIANYRGRLLWYENENGEGDFGEAKYWSDTRIPGLISIETADVDNDRDTDILVASSSGTVFWIENTDGRGRLARESIISENGAFAPIAGDVDGDGDLDVLSVSYNDKKISWHENTDGRGTFGNDRTVSETFEPVSAISIGDIDADGDIDIVAGALGTSRIGWFENIDNGSFSSVHMLSGAFERPESLYVVDVDGDDNPDVIAASRNNDSLSWFENRTVGDSNNDGFFNSSDLVRVFQAGEYEVGINGDSTFDSGDWNGDGNFTSADLVVAFQAGTFVTAVGPADIAAAVDVVLSEDNLALFMGPGTDASLCNGMRTSMKNLRSI